MAITGIPQPGALPSIHSEHTAVIRTPLNGTHLTNVTTQGKQLTPGLDVPDPGVAVGAAAKQALAAAVESDSVDAPVVFADVQRGATAGVPDAYRPAFTGRRHQVPIRAERRRG